MQFKVKWEIKVSRVDGKWRVSVSLAGDAPGCEEVDAYLKEKYELMPYQCLFWLFDTEEEALSFAREVRDVLKSGEIMIREWYEKGELVVPKFELQLI